MPFKGAVFCCQNNTEGPSFLYSFLLEKDVTQLSYSVPEMWKPKIGGQKVNEDMIF